MKRGDRMELKAKAKRIVQGIMIMLHGYEMAENCEVEIVGDGFRITDLETKETAVFDKNGEFVRD